MHTQVERDSVLSRPFDYIIIGGGSAGCVMANRLSARSSNRVLLLEAGDDTPDGRVPEIIMDGCGGNPYRDPRFLWNQLEVTTETQAPNATERPRTVRYEQARVLGGGSSINGQIANRGAPADYDEWEARGATGWRWDTVLPFFKKIERDMDFVGPLHGSEGRIPVSREFPDNWSPLTNGVADALEAKGFKYLADQNGEFEDGYYPIALSNLHGRRVSAAVGYLGATVRQRPNLTISTNTHVCNLLFENGNCVGVRAMVGQQETSFFANEVILCSGAIHSPAILMRSGIGPAEHLRELGIPVRANMPGVGQGLTDHPSISVSSFVKPHARAKMAGRRVLLLGMRFSSGLQDAPPGDMALTLSVGLAGRITMMTLCVNKTFSEAGQVRLASTDWQQEPLVDFNLLQDTRDVTRMVDGFRRIASLHDLPALKAVTSDPFPTSFSYKARKVTDVNFKAKLLTAIGSRLIDGPGMLRRFMIRNFVMESPSIERLVQDRQLLADYIKRATVGVWHCSCSCRMGSEDDPMAVTNASGQVYGVNGLRVVDASIFPAIPCANTNFPVMMVAEKISNDILSMSKEKVALSVSA
jgi:5-(hydroxymethyl)furfural/furfural oxidase